MAPSIRAILPALGLVALVLGGCTDDPEPSATDQDSPSEAAGEACGGVTMAALTEATGTSQTLSSGDDADPARTSCSTKLDESGLALEWRTRPLIGSFDTEGDNAQLPGLERERVELAPDVPAWRLQGVVAGSRVASYVVVLGDTTLEVEASDFGQDAAFTDQQAIDATAAVAQIVVDDRSAS